MHTDSNLALLEELEPGDIVEFPRTGYSHYAIYKGDGEVIHRTGPADMTASIGVKHIPSSSGSPTNKAEVKVERFLDVAGDSKARITNKYDGDFVPYSGAEVVKRAKARVGEVGYNLFTDNCQHFANGTRYGVQTSDQADNAMIAAVAIGVGVGIGAMAYGVHKLYKYLTKEEKETEEPQPK